MCGWLAVLSAQVYKVAARAFLPKEWIMEQWDKGFYITAIAGTLGPGQGGGASGHVLCRLF